MSFEYRLRFHLLPEDRINEPSSRVAVPIGSGHLRLQGGKLDTPISEGPRLTMVGGPFECIDEAREDGLRTRRAILLWALQRRLAVDFGDGRKRGGITQEGSKFFAEMFGGPVRNQLHGLDVYEYLDNQKFLLIEAQPGLAMDPESSINSIASWYEQDIQITEKQELSAELFCSAHFDAPFRSRFLTLMTALEALLDYSPRSSSVRDLINVLEQTVSASQVSKEEKQSLLGSLNWLHNESIGQAGKRLAAKLIPDAVYNGLSSTKYFRSCYDLRSVIVHTGRIPDDVDLLAVSNELYRFVGDLLHASIGIPSIP